MTLFIKGITSKYVKNAKVPESGESQIKSSLLDKLRSLLNLRQAAHIGQDAEITPENIKRPRPANISIKQLFKGIQSRPAKLDHPDMVDGSRLDDRAEGPDIGLYFTFQDYMADAPERRAKRQRRRQYESSLINVPEKPFEVNGHCVVCKTGVNFSVDFNYAYEHDEHSALIPNWRESLVCSTCGMNNRIRAVIDIFTNHMSVEDHAVIYATEQLTPFFAWLHKNYAHVIGSEFLGDEYEPGQVQNGLRHEDITQLSFSDASLDYILSFEVLEHVPDTDSSLAEFMRVLDSGGFALVTAPFVSNNFETIVRASVDEDGQIEHLLEPEYHGNPTKPDEGSLCFYHFGWDLLEKFKAAGARDAAVISYYSAENANLGNEQLFFLIQK